MFKHVKFNKMWLRILFIFWGVTLALRMYMGDAWTGNDTTLSIIIAMVIGWNLIERPVKDEKKDEDDK